MLGSYSRNENESNSEDRNIEKDIESNRLRLEIVQNGEDLRSLLNPNSRENREITFETMRLVNSEVSKKIDELKRDSNSRVAETINSVISEKKNPSKYSEYHDQSKSSVSVRNGPQVQGT